MSLVCLLTFSICVWCVYLRLVFALGVFSGCCVYLRLVFVFGVFTGERHPVLT